MVLRWEMLGGRSTQFAAQTRHQSCVTNQKRATVACRTEDIAANIKQTSLIRFKPLHEANTTDIFMIAR